MTATSRIAQKTTEANAKLSGLKIVTSIRPFLVNIRRAVTGDYKVVTTENPMAKPTPYSVGTSLEEINAVFERGLR